MSSNVVIMIVMGVYLIFMILVGFFFKSRVKHFDDFILGGRGLPWFVIAMTLLATLANAQQVLGIAGFSYGTGLSFMVWFFIIVNIFIFPLMKRLGTRYRDMNFSTIVDLAEERFPGSGRMTILMSIFQVMWAVFSVGICLFGGAILIEAVFNVPWLVGIAISGTVTVIYCIMGGLNAVVFTDLIQWIIIVIGTAFIIPLLFMKYGTFTDFFSNLLGSAGMTANESTGLWAGFTDLFTLPPGGFITVKGIIAMGIAGSLWIPVDLGFMQRMLAAKSAIQARKASLAFIFVITAWATLMVAIGMYGRVILPELSIADTVVILLAKAAMPVFGAALFITAVTAAVMSTVSTYLNAGAAILVKNIVVRFSKKERSDASNLMLARIFTVIIVVAAMFFAPLVKNGGVFVMALTIQMIICSSLAPMVIFSTYWKRMTERAAFWGTIASGIITTVITIQVGGGGAAFAGAGLWGIPVVFLGLIVSTIMYLILSLIQPYNPESIGPQFQQVFSKQKTVEKIKNTDLIVIGSIIAIILITLLIRSRKDGVIPAFPSLSGPGAWFTNAYFIVVAAGVTALCIYVLIRSFGWIKSIQKDK